MSSFLIDQVSDHLPAGTRPVVLGGTEQGCLLGCLAGRVRRATAARARVGEKKPVKGAGRGKARGQRRERGGGRRL
ncbi:MAG: hypothetical protein ACT4NY_15120, partial [Pseudonocardiales bacterium]